MEPTTTFAHAARRRASTSPLPGPASKPQRTELGTTQGAPSHNDYFIGWVCALPLDLAAARGMLDEEREELPGQPGDTNLYTLGRIGYHNVVLTCLPDYGTARAAAVSSNMKRSFLKIRVGLMIGVDGGVPGGTDVRLGDVVVGDSITQYLGKTVSGGHFQRTGTSNSSPPDNLAAAVRRLHGEHMLKPSRIPDLLTEMLQRYPWMADCFARPGDSPD